MSIIFNKSFLPNLPQFSPLPGKKVAMYTGLSLLIAFLLLGGIVLSFDVCNLSPNDLHKLKLLRGCGSISLLTCLYLFYRLVRNENRITEKSLYIPDSPVYDVESHWPPWHLVSGTPRREEDTDINENGLLYNPTQCLPFEDDFVDEGVIGKLDENGLLEQARERGLTIGSENLVDDEEENEAIDEVVASQKATLERLEVTQTFSWVYEPIVSHLKSAAPISIDATLSLSTTPTFSEANWHIVSDKLQEYLNIRVRNAVYEGYNPSATYIAQTIMDFANLYQLKIRCKGQIKIGSHVVIIKQLSS